MSTMLKLRSGIEVSRYWSNKRFYYQVPAPLDADDVLELADYVQNGYEEHERRATGQVASAAAERGEIHTCRCGHEYGTHDEEGDCGFPGCPCGLFHYPLGDGPRVG